MLLLSSDNTVDKFSAMISEIESAGGLFPTTPAGFTSLCFFASGSVVDAQTWPHIAHKTLRHGELRSTGNDKDKKNGLMQLGVV